MLINDSPLLDWAHHTSKHSPTVFLGRAARKGEVGPIGSGDAFSAALGAGLVLGADPQHVLQVACEAGAAAVQKKGALVDLPDCGRDAFA